MKKILLSVVAIGCVLTATAEEPNSPNLGPTMGWSSWNTFSVHISEDIIKGQADAMVSQGLKDAGYEYINIDDGFQYGRTSEGKVRIHPERFPNGLKVVSDYIHSKGLKAGIYSDAGDCTCGSISNGDVLNTNVGMYGYEQVDADYYFKECEFDFIKVDYCGGIHLNLNEQKQYTAISEAIKNTGRDVRYNLCRWAYPGTWCHNVSTSWRTTGDIYDGWESVKSILNENLYMSAYCYDGCYNDMDMLEVGRSMTEEEDKTHFGMWCIMDSPLLIGCNMATINERSLNLLKNKELIALNQDSLYLQAYVVQHTGDTYVFVKDILNLHGTTRAVALYNPSDKEVPMSVSFSELDLGGKVRVRDLFEHKDLGTMEKVLTANVPAHGTRIYSLEAETRLVRYLYEAETAYLGDYQEVVNNESAGTAIYQTGTSASGGVYAGWLGNRRSNYLEWKDVHVSEAGEYVIRISAACKENRSFTVQLNGEKAGAISVQTSDWTAFKEYDIVLNLKAGSNSIQLYNENAWMPNIDYMIVEKKGEASVIGRRLEEAAARLTGIIEVYQLPEAINQKIEALLVRASSVELTMNEKDLLVSEIEMMVSDVEQIIPLCEEYRVWKEGAQKNIAVSAESGALTTLVDKMERADESLAQANTKTAVNSAVSSLKSALRTYFRADGSKPKDGESLDMTLLIVNYDFSTNSGWQGNPTYRSGCGEEFNNSFDLYQLLPSMKSGIYTVKCNALYRTGKNDGGAAYRAGTENIQAVFYVNSQTQEIKSLYSETWTNASKYGSVDNLNGYPNSMHAAEMRFAEGCYENVIEFTQQTKSALKIGLRCNTQQNDCWCCFDNFSIMYKPLPEESGIKTKHRSKKTTNTAYTTHGYRANGSYQGIVVRNGVKKLKHLL